MPPACPIVLVHLPFGPLQWPSAALGALSAAAKRAGLACRTTYPAFGFAEQIGYRLYNFVSRALGPDTLLQDWIFSAHLLDDQRDRPWDYVDALNRMIDQWHPRKLAEEPAIRAAIADNPALAHFFDERGSLRAEPLIALRRQAAGFVTRTAEAIVAGRPRLIGCSTSFLQFNAAISLCKEIKRLAPGVVTALGGSGTEAEIGYQTMRRFPCVDLVFSGEADGLFPAVCRDLLAGHGLAEISEHHPAGLLARPFIDRPHDRAAAEKRFRPRLEADLDALAIPDYDGYFAELAATPLAETFAPPLPAEGSRGCWKGAAQHCAFCSLQGERMAYRAKSPRRLLDELDKLHARHGNSHFLMTDTIIDMRCFKEVLPELAGRPYAFYYEVPPKLSEAQVKALADANVCWIQPGIESLDDALLARLNKGNRAIRNIETLKYCREYGIRTRWNILYNIPGEDDDSYRRMERIVPLICHLPPPFLAAIRFDRFSPYHRHGAAYGVRLRPLSSHRFVYPFSQDELADFAQYFECEQPQFASLAASPAKASLAERVGEWWRLTSSAPPRLVQEPAGDDIVITDTRPVARSPRHRLTGAAAGLYRACRQATPFAELAAALGPDRAGEILDGLRRDGLAIEMDGVWLALATNPPQRPTAGDV